MEYHEIYYVGYNGKCGVDQRAAGCLTYLEVTKTRAGRLRMRWVDGNGRYYAAGESWCATKEEVRQAIERADMLGQPVDDNLIKMLGL